MRLGFYELVALLIFAVLVLLPLRIQYCRKVGALLRSTRQHHDEDPQLAWLLLIPVLSVGWQYHLLRLLAKALKRRGDDVAIDASDTGYGLGLAHVIFGTAGGLVPSMEAGTAVRSGLFLASTVFWLLYWAQLSALTRRLDGASPTASSQPTS